MLYIILYPSLKFDTYVIYLAFILFLLLGISFGLTINIRPHKPWFRISAERLLKTLTVISLFTTVVSWYMMINKYGSISYIFAHAFDIRTENIGTNESLVPIYITYSASVQYLAFILSLSCYSRLKGKKYIFYALLLFINIVVYDLQTFGRIGILFSIFAVISWMFLNNIKIFTVKRLFLVFILYIILMLPRLFRGSFDNFSSTVDNYVPYFTMKLPEFLYGPITIYIYYFSSIYAFDSLIQNNIDCMGGMRNFAPVINIMNRLLNVENGRVILITESVNIPFEYNIYHIIGEMYMDFNIVGLILLPVIFGSIIGRIFKIKDDFALVLKVFVLVWIFYSPIYNIFSFGSFLISLLLSYFISFSARVYYEK